MVIAGTISAWMLLTSSAYIAPQAYQIQNGDTFTGLAKKFGVTSTALQRANWGLPESKLQIGSSVTIPGRFSTDIFASYRVKPEAQGGYLVRNGDTDWSIARKSGIKPNDLHAMNPNVDWTRLQIGQRLKVAQAGTTVASNSLTPQLSAVTPTKPKSSSGSYVVQSGDNDWTIASKYGVKASDLRALNPGVKWTCLQIGTKLQVPGSGSVSSSTTRVAVNRIRTKRAVINGEGISIRRSPSTDGERITTAELGTVAAVLDREGSWYKLKFPRGTVGWVRGDLLGPVKASSYVASSSRRNRYASNSGRTRRSSGSHRGLVASNAKSSSGLIGTAENYLGVRYRWGGTSSRGFDCSGFVSTVYRKHGVSLPRRSSEQSRSGSRVSRSQLQKGDLVFFRTTRGKRISHVGIYMGNGKFIHASSGGGHVKVSSLNEGYYSRRFAGGSRVKVKASKGSKSSKTSKSKSQKLANTVAEQMKRDKKK